MEVLFYIWLTGWVGFSGYGTYDCITNEQYSLTKTQCVGYTVAGATLWPVGVATALVMKDVRF